MLDVLRTSSNRKTEGNSHGTRLLTFRPDLAKVYAASTAAVLLPTTATSAALRSVTTAASLCASAKRFKLTDGVLPAAALHVALGLVLRLQYCCCCACCAVLAMLDLACATWLCMKRT
jgi:hypothetical protein